MKRYHTNAIGLTGHTEMFEFDYGDWCKYADVEPIVEENKTLKQRIKTLEDTLEEVEKIRERIEISQIKSSAILKDLLDKM